MRNILSIAKPSKKENYMLQPLACLFKLNSTKI